MSADTLNTEPEHMRTVALDALALTACAVNGRQADGDLLLSTYTDQAERDELLCAVLAHATCAIKALALQCRVSPDVVLGRLADMLRGMP